MIRSKYKSPTGTSFHGSTIKTTVSKLTNALGKAHWGDNSGRDKTNFTWVCEINGKIFTIYDWEEYRPINEDEIIEFHIGGFRESVTEKAKNELLEILK